MRSELRIDLEVKIDKNGNRYLVANPGMPATIDLSKVVFFVWPDDPEGASILIAPEKPRVPRDDSHGYSPKPRGDQDR